MRIQWIYYSSNFITVNYKDKQSHTFINKKIGNYELVKLWERVS